MRRIETLLRARVWLRRSLSSEGLADLCKGPREALRAVLCGLRALGGKLDLGGRHESFSSLSRCPVAPWAKGSIGSLLNAYVTVTPLLSEGLTVTAPSPAKPVPAHTRPKADTRARLHAIYLPTLTLQHGYKEATS